MPVENLHQTLVFLGGVPQSDVARIVSPIEPIVDRTPPFEVSIGKGSGRPRREDDGVAWLTLDRGGADTSELARELHSALIPWLGPTRGGRRGRPVSTAHRPHVTVARRASESLIAELGSLHPEPSIAWRADHVVLFRSHLGPPGARYVALHDLPLGRSREGSPTDASSVVR